MKKISLLLLFTLLAFIDYAQTAASYVFTPLSSPFVSISATGTAVPVIQADDATQTTIPIGFSFTYCGTPYTTLSACSNGWLSFANSASSQRTNSAANVVSAGFLMPYWDDLEGTNGLAYYKTTGAVGSRIFTFEWKNWQEYALVLGFIPSQANNISMQVKLYEGTNVIEFNYGAAPTLGNPVILTTISTSGTIGIANSTVDYKTLNAASASPTASSATFTTTLGNAPPANTLYRWSPNCTLTTTAGSNSAICSGSTLSLTDAVTGVATGYLWSGPAGFSSASQNPSIANAATARSGVYTVTTSAATCTVTATTTVVVDTTPVATISGTTSFCSGGSSTITLTGTAGATVFYNINGGGSLNTVLNAAGVATISTGVLTTGTYTYTLTSVTKGSCSRTLATSAVITVNPPPSNITGNTFVCQGGFTTSLFNSSGSGTWATGNPGIASVNSGTGLVTGLTPGNANITFTLTSTGCSVSTTVTVNPTPSAITGNTAVCEGGGITTLSDPSGTGTWSSGSPLVATITSPGGVVTGLIPGNAVITFTLPTTCAITTTVVVSPALGPITGSPNVCQGGVTSLTPPTGGGTWSCNPITTASVDPSGFVYGVVAGPATVTYSMPTGCSVTRAVTVNPLPVAISGVPVVCQGLSVTLNDATPGGSWSSANPGIASIDANSGLLTGNGSGNTLIIYTLTTTACTANILATVNALPAAITGATNTVCAGGATIVLNSSPGTGTWSSGATAIATATGTASGVITGVSSGVAPITYTITSTGCIATTTVNVLPIPAPITGTLSVCEAGSVTTLNDATTPGTWGSSFPGIATVSSSGVVTGLIAGNTTITYTRSNNCFVTADVTVNPLPAALTGIFSVCQLSVTSLNSTSSPGTWSSGSPFIASVNAVGDVSGLLPGTSVITYTLPTGCLTTHVVTVNPIPAPIMGNNYVCIGYTTALTDATGTGTWSSTPSSTASIDASGTVYGLALGTFDVNYTTGTNGCFATKAMTVNPIVSAGMSLTVNPGTTVCAGTTVTFIANPVNGGASPLYVWSVNNVILSGASSYTYTPANGDLVRCWIISSYSCAQPDTASAWVHMVVNPIVTPGLSLSTAGGDTVCAGAAAVISAVPVAGGPTPVYQWVVNLAPVPGATPVLTYTPANGDIIHCTMISNAPCSTAPSASATKVLTVSPPLTPLVGLTASMGPTVCEGYPNIYTATQINGGWSPTYQWTISGGPVVSTSPVYGYTPTNGDLVQVTMTSSFPCLTTPTATNTMLMTVVPIVAPVGAIDVTPGYIIAPGTAAHFSVTVVSGGGLSPSYQWMVNAVPIAGATNTTFTISTLNNGDSVSCVVTNTDLCSSVATFNAVKMSVGYNTGIQQTGNNTGISLVPNPNNGSFAVKGAIGTTDEQVVIEVTDMVGQVLYSTKAQLTDGQLNEHISLHSTIANGMYLLNVKTPSVNKVFHFVLEQ